MEVGPSTDSNKWVRWPTDDSAGTEDWWWFEKIDQQFWYDFLDNYQWILLATNLSAYYVVMFLARSFMKNRKPYTNLKPLIAAYQIVMSLFSIHCFTQTGPVLLNGFGDRDWIHQRLCIRSSKLTSRLAFWTLLIAWSKFVHILDSFFLILLKKDVPFFQIYHHSLAMSFSVIVDWGEPIIVIIGAANLIQLSITYAYFATKVLKIRLPRFVPKVILGVELVQMLIGLGAGIYTEYIISTGRNCVRHPKSIRYLHLVFSSILILVVHEIYNLFIRRRGRRKNE